MAEQEQNRSEAATPFKLEEARRKGNVPKSADMSSLLILATAAAVLHFKGPQIAAAELKLFRDILTYGFPARFEVSQLAHQLTGWTGDALALLTPLLLSLVLVAACGNFIQVGPVFSFFPIKPDLERVNPIAGFKRIFSARMLAEALKSIFKLVVLAAVIWSVITNQLPVLLSTLNMSPTEVGKVIWPQLDDILGKLIAVLALVMLFDLGYSRWEFSRRMRMSKREIQEEVKRREGDPRVRSRLRELQREAVKRAKSLARVKDADVLITNPVKLAIAVKYDKERLDAPIVLAKGAGFLARRMKTLACRHGIPVVENRPLARALFNSVGIEQPVPEIHYGVMARIILWADAARKARAGR